MQLLYVLESIRFPLLNELMLLITQFGDETAFLVAALIIFWCVDKNRAYYVLGVGFCGTILNQFLKLVWQVPRPWVQDPGFQPVEGAVGAAEGYSFPSGHSQSSVGTFGALAATEKNKALKWIFIAICVLVPFSRMYLGVHFPSDVLVGIACAVALIFLMRFLSRGDYVKQTLAAMCALAVVYLCFVCFVLDSSKMDAYNYTHGLENAFTMLGATFGMLLVYWIDNKWVHFSVKAVWWAQILKVMGGLAAVLSVKVGTKSVLNVLLGEYAGRAARYFLVVLVAGALWPLTFRYFERLGKKES